MVVGLVTTAAPAVLLLTSSTLAASLVFAIAIGPMVAFTVWSRRLRNRLIDRRTFALQASVMMVGTTLASPVAGVSIWHSWVTTSRHGSPSESSVSPPSSAWSSRSGHSAADT